MRQTTGAKINILEGSDRGGQTKVRIEGSKKEISAAKARIDQLLSWAETRTPRDTLSGMSCRSVPAAVLSNWGLAEVVEFFSKTGCLLGVKNNYVKIKGFDKDDMLYAEEQLHELVEDATHNGSPDMAQYRTTHDLGRLHLDEQETSRSSTQAQRKVSEDLKRKAAQSKKAKVKDRLQSN